jgi:hypothetical protein
MAGVELTYVTAAEFLHESCDRANFWRRHQQMSVVIHQNIGVQFAVAVEQRLAE